jgi:hypothetical protein
MHPMTIKASSAFLGIPLEMYKRIGIHTLRPSWHPPRRAQTSRTASQALYPHSYSKPPSFLILLTSAQTQWREAAPDRVRQTAPAVGQVPGLALDQALAQAQAQPAQDPTRPYGSTLSAATDCTCLSSTAPAGSSTPSSMARCCLRQKKGAIPFVLAPQSWGEGYLHSGIYWVQCRLEGPRGTRKKILPLSIYNP